MVGRHGGRDDAEDHGERVHDSRRPRCLSRLSDVGSALDGAQRTLSKHVVRPVRRRHDGRHGSTIVSRHQRTWSEKALDPGEPAWLIDYRRYLDRVEKVCLSHRLTSSDWENSRILSGDLAEILEEVRREEGGNIILEGGPAVVRECLRRDLADDYWFFVMPVVYGKGPRYWGPMDRQTTLSLIETKPGKNKEILLHYEAVR